MKIEKFNIFIIFNDLIANIPLKIHALDRDK
jgi:hypothetical protein